MKINRENRIKVKLSTENNYVQSLDLLQMNKYKDITNSQFAPICHVQSKGKIIACVYFQRTWRDQRKLLNLFYKEKEIREDW